MRQDMQLNKADYGILWFLAGALAVILIVALG
jgi:hypothetical protein